VLRIVGTRKGIIVAKHGRSLANRVGEYRDNLVSIAEQLVAVADDLVTVRPSVTPEELAPLTDAAKLYRQIAVDLDVILNGEELKGFAVTGVINPE
jgi:hypothetical protein